MGQLICQGRAPERPGRIGREALAVLRLFRQAAFGGGATHRGGARWLGREERQLWDFLLSLR